MDPIRSTAASVGLRGTNFPSVEGDGTAPFSVDDWCDAVENDLDKLKDMLQRHPSNKLPERNVDGDTLLHVAVKGGKSDALKSLVEKFGRDSLEEQDREGLTPFLRAARLGNYREVGILAGAGANVGARDLQGNTALMLSVLEGHDTTFRRLLTDDDLILNATNNDGCTALMLACSENRPDFVSRLCMFGADLNRTNYAGHNALTLAARECDRSTLEILLENGASDPVGPNARRALVEAALVDNPAAVGLLWATAKSTTGDSVPDERRVFEAAVYGSSTRALEMLTKLSPDFDLDSATEGRTLMEFAIELKNVWIMGPLIRLGANVNNVNAGLTPSMAAAMVPVDGLDHPLTVLADNGADLNAVTPLGTALSAAVSGLNAGTIHLLCDLGANVDHPFNNTGRTPLMLAASLGDEETIRALLVRSADLSLTDDMGNRAINYVEPGRDDIEALLQPRAAA